MDNTITFTPQLRWLIMLRWVGIGIALIAAVVAQRLGMISGNLAPLYGILAFPALFNLLFSWQARYDQARRSRTILAQILVDQMTLAGLVAVSGACHSPFHFFFLFHVVISGILLPYRYTIGVACCAAVLPLVAVGIHHAGLIPPYDIFNHAQAAEPDLQTVITHGFVFFMTLFLTTYFAVYLSRELQRSREDLAGKNQKLSALVRSSRAASSQERNRLATESFRLILKDDQANAEIVLLNDAPDGPVCSDFFKCGQSSCPGFQTAAPCWKLSGTRCASHLPPSRPDVKPGAAAPEDSSTVAACFLCDFFRQTAAAQLSPETALAGDCSKPRPRCRQDAAGRALQNGIEALQGGAQHPALSSAAFPLIMQEQLSGLLFLSASAAKITGDQREFITLFSELTSSGLIGSNIINVVETSYLQTVMALANAIEAKDPYTKGHSERVAYYSIRIADALGLTKQEKEHLSFAAILHDVGKIGVSEGLLLKTERLTGEERDIMRAHPEIGARILEPVHFLKPAISAIKHHHEMYDGSGYPGGLQGEDIPFKARIINIADAWDAMTSDRAYRRALPQEKAIQELMRFAGTQFDREITEVFVELVVAGRCA